MGTDMLPDAEFSSRCTACGEVDLAVDQIWLVLAVAPLRNQYAFQCPSCSAVEHRAADDDTVALLSRFVAVEQLEIPAEALEQHVGGALTADDVIDLMLSIAAFETNGSTTVS
ncbi:MAG TPA: hypothetical protein VGH11_01685 [Jatrophihabitans sp.]|jgi:hypothetical protein